jgi:hypothetical protein
MNMIVLNNNCLSAPYYFAVLVFRDNHHGRMSDVGGGGGGRPSVNVDLRFGALYGFFNQKLHVYVQDR